ncbi:DUF998 domain-containing protein [Cryptosporangium sp. NPDC051539]|uniref:DUF998 domain-containing protein n=1 Tax=Cryptosporangium sp. NPDC051539 TaxID=3363962 RepID=UPI00379DB6BF
MTTITAPRVRPAGLLLAGALAGPLFFASAVTQMLTRDGFDLTRHPISQLSTGGLGWIQIATFVVAGLGVLALAGALSKTETALSILIGIFGAGLIVSGLFTMDPQYNFPAGTPDGPVDHLSWHGIVHATAALITFTAPAIAAIVLAVRYVRRRSARLAVLNGAVALALLLPLPSVSVSIQIAVAGVVAFTWTTVLALSLIDGGTR